MSETDVVTARRNSVRAFSPSTLFPMSAAAGIYDKIANAAQRVFSLELYFGAEGRRKTFCVLLELRIGKAQSGIRTLKVTTFNSPTT